MIEPFPRCSFSEDNAPILVHIRKRLRESGRRERDRLTEITSKSIYSVIMKRDHRLMKDHNDAERLRGGRAMQAVHQSIVDTAYAEREETGG